MQIQVKGKQIDVGDALTEHVETHLQAAIQKYFDRPVEVVVTFSRDARAFRCDSHVHLPTGLVAQSSGRAAALSECSTCSSRGARLWVQMRTASDRVPTGTPWTQQH